MDITRDVDPNQPGKKTLRDEFAIAALEGLAAYPGRVSETNEPHHFAQWAYALADAMLVERLK